jgi:hypothetical protein
MSLPADELIVLVIVFFLGLTCCLMRALTSALMCNLYPNYIGSLENKNRLGMRGALSCVALDLNKTPTANKNGSLLDAPCGVFVEMWVASSCNTDCTILCNGEIKMTKDDIPNTPLEAVEPATTAKMSPPVDTAKAKPVAKTKSAAKQKPAAKSAPKKTPPKATDREGLITVVAIAKEYKLSAPEARALLRAAKLKKPAVGWAFAPASPELKKVREVLKAGKAK